MAVLRCGKHSVPLDRPLLMGVVNVTPDSFSDGGRFFAPGSAIAHAERLAEDGADIIDVGGESTRPGALPVSAQQEMDRVLPVLEGLKTLQKPISVDTRRPEVMQAALGAGASMINDIEALQAPGALEAVASSGCAVCLMHMRGEPATMQQGPAYDDVVGDVLAFLLDAAERGRRAGVREVWIDPGIGFGKTADHNWALIAHLDRFVATGLPVLVGTSRKGFLGAAMRDADGAEAVPGPLDRLEGSIATAAWAATMGAAMIRVHDVRATVAALDAVASAGAVA